MTEIIDKIINEKKAFIYPSQPGPYGDIDEDANIRIDFINEIQPGINFNFTKEKFNNEFSILGGIKPLYYQAKLLNKTFKNHNFDITVFNGQNIELNYIMKPSIRGIGAKFTLGSPLSRSFKNLSSIAEISHHGKRSTLEIKATNLEPSNLKHRLVGFSYIHSINNYLSLGCEAHYKFIQASGGLSIGARFRNEIAGLQYSLTSVYGVMGDFKLSATIGLIPKLLSISTRFNINTSSMLSNTEVGARILTKPIINGYKIPICIKLRTNTNLENAISIDVNTPAVTIGLSTFGNKLDLLNNFGINFEI